jgi:hypothetical protein
MILDAFVTAAWSDHAADPAAVWARLPGALELLTASNQVFPVAHLAAHVAGEHLGWWDDGLSLLEAITRHPVYDADSIEGKGVQRLRAVLLTCAGRVGEADDALARAIPAGTRPETPRIRMLAAAASALAAHRRTAEANAALDQALAAADPETPAARDLAIAGNNVAAALEERADRTDDETALMLRAAQLGRTFWAIAGDWTNVERAAYRLAQSSLAAGRVDEARAAAAECLAIVLANGSLPLELFHAHEVTALVALAAGDRAGALAARDAAAAVADPACAGALAQLDARLR